MITFAFEFPACRYHATPWGRSANEADVAWPPEPVRILRALIATWWRKADHERFPQPVLDELVDALAMELPVFSLPQAVHTHVRAFVPAPTRRTLIYDAFLRLDRGAELVANWPGVELTPRQRTLCDHLLTRMGYLGRAESWVEARVADGWNGEINARPRWIGNRLSAEGEAVDVAAPVTPPDWTRLRDRLLVNAHGVTKSKRAAIEATLPERLSDALTVDTGAWQRIGWSSPPPLRKIVYDRPRLMPTPPPRPWRASTRREQPGVPQVARFVLAGRPSPRVEDSLRIGEITRSALMAIGGGSPPPPEISGRDAAGARRDDPAHAHAFFLPEDADCDGLIDHIVVYCRYGFRSEARRRLEQLRALWLAHGRADEEGVRGRREWRVALEDIAGPEEFAAVSKLVRPSRSWRSATPYLMPWYAKRGFGPLQQVRREIERRGGFKEPAHVTQHENDGTHKSRRAIQFQRIRSRRGLVQPDTLGTFLSLEFAEAAPGPVALGFGCHYGLGLFIAADEGIAPAGPRLEAPA